MYLKKGYYAAAWASDQIVETARKLGLTLMLCIENANGTVNGDTSKNRVKYNFYMKENGGPLDNIKDFWCNEEVKRLYMQKIRYCVARWGANPAIGVWESLSGETTS